MTCRLIAALSLTMVAACAVIPVTPPAPPAELATTPAWETLASRVEIRRTEYGVPHILAEDLRSAGFGLAWVQLEDYGAERIADGLLRARGESAMTEGRGALDSDLLARRAHLRAAETFPLLPGQVQAVYEGFAQGVNRYLELHPEEAPRPALPRFTGVDVAARDVVEPAWSVGRRFAARAGSGEPVHAAGMAVPEDGAGALRGWEPGSNTWAFGPSRTTSGRAILMRNPHLSWTAGYYEAHVTVPGVLNFYGDFRIGGPFGIIGGFNDRLGWSTTNNAPELNDIYALALDPSRPDHYLFDGHSRPLVGEAVALGFIEDDVLKSETRELWETSIGPVIHRADNHVYVLRTGGMDSFRLGEQFLRMMTASSLDEWRDAMRLQARNMSTFTYADADGNIFYVWNAAHPVRPHPHHGDTLAVLAHGSEHVWSEVMAFDDLPQLLNPPGGYLRNENDPFHYTNLNAVLDPARFPAEFPEPRLRLRSQLSLELVHGDRRFSLEDVWSAKHSTRMLLADRVKVDLMAAVAASGPGGEVAAAARLLEAWDNTAAADSRGAVLFVEWWDRYRAGGERAPSSAASAGFAAAAESLFREPWTPARVATTPRGLADPERAAAAFAEAVAAVRDEWGGWDVAWGEVHRARVGDVDLPVGGCDGMLGCFRVLWFSDDEDGRRRVRGGDGWVSAVEFGDPPRAYTVLAYGQSARDGHPHQTDQVGLFVDGGAKTVAFTEADIQAGLVRSYRPGVERRQAPPVAAEMAPYDLLLRGGRVYDGSGSEWREADVAIRDGRIVAVGELGVAGQAPAPDVLAREVVDLDGLYVAPGFIDTHSHAAGALATERLSHAQPLLAQGITTILANPDGGGAVDLPAQRAALLEHGLGVNVGQMVPHGSVRRAVLGMEDRAPDRAELERMRELVRAGMEAGAMGMSSGPYYAPGSYADTDELVALARVVAEYGGVHQSHIRDEGDFSIGLLAAVDELIEVSRRSGVTGVVTHVKALGPDVWGLSEAVVARIEAARAEGLDIYADQYPYHASATSLSGALAPRWALAGGRDSLQARAARPADRSRLVADMAENLRRRGGADRIQFRRFGPDPSVEGRTLADVAAERGADAVVVALDMLLAGSPGIVSFNMHEDDIARFMRQPWTMTASDGEFVALGAGVPHPRAYGTFPRKLGHYARDLGVVDVAWAIRSMTYLPARVYGLADRGLVREGMVADLVVFDLERVNDPATFTEPHQYGEGMVHVLMGGRFAIRGGEFTDERHGTVLRRGAR